ncbi:MAG: DinB family protein, partial [Saprospiraceae bacterium]
FITRIKTMTAFDILRATRKNILKTINGLTLEQFNTIPAGFNNNLGWQVGHVIVTQQLLCYRLAGQECNVSEKMIAAFRKGSKPEQQYDAEDIALFKKLLETTINRMESDYNDGIFMDYKEYTTSYGFTIKSVEAAIEFNNVHEGMHLGWMVAMKRLV